MDTAELMGHVKDAYALHLPQFLGGHVELPQPFGDLKTGEGFLITKFMYLELVAAVILFLIFIPLAQKIKTGQPPKGRWWNLIESMLLFMRNDVARPAIGGKEADRFLPFIWTIFFFCSGL